MSPPGYDKEAEEPGVGLVSIDRWPLSWRDPLVCLGQILGRAEPCFLTSYHLWPPGNSISGCGLWSDRPRPACTPGDPGAVVEASHRQYPFVMESFVWVGCGRAIADTGHSLHLAFLFLIMANI